MQTELNKLQELFEIERWYFIDNSVTKERKEFWEDKFEKFPDLKIMLEDTQKISTTFSDLPSHEINEEKLIEALAIATTESYKEKIKSILLSFISPGDEPKRFFIPKLAFGAILVVSAFILIFTSEKNNPIKNIGMNF